MKVISRKLLMAASSLLIVFVTTTTTSAQERHISLNAGGGFTPVTGKLGNSLDNGWNIFFGAGYSFTAHFETNFEVGYNGFGLTSGLISGSGVPNGNAHLWSFTVDPKLRLGREDHKIDPYVVGGVGYYRRTVNFTNPVLVPVTGFDPFLGFVTGLTTANQILGTQTDDGIGGSAGLGFDVKAMGHGIGLFLEARYHYADTGRIPTRIVPITLGIRW
jgi:hypothetical protein